MRTCGAKKHNSQLKSGAIGDRSFKDGHDEAFGRGFVLKVNGREIEWDTQNCNIANVTPRDLDMFVVWRVTLQSGIASRKCLWSYLCIFCDHHRIGAAQISMDHEMARPTNLAEEMGADVF